MPVPSKGVWLFMDLSFSLREFTFVRPPTPPAIENQLHKLEDALVDQIL